MYWYLFLLKYSVQLWATESLTKPAPRLFKVPFQDFFFLNFDPFWPPVPKHPKDPFIQGIFCLGWLVTRLRILKNTLRLKWIILNIKMQEVFTVFFLECFGISPGMFWAGKAHPNPAVSLGNWRKSKEKAVPKGISLFKGLPLFFHSKLKTGNVNYSNGRLFLTF